MTIRNVNIDKMMEILIGLKKKCDKVDLELDVESNQVIFHPIYEDKTEIKLTKIDISNITKLI